MRAPVLVVEHKHKIGFKAPFSSSQAFDHKHHRPMMLQPYMLPAALRSDQGGQGQHRSQPRDSRGLDFEHEIAAARPSDLRSIDINRGDRARLDTDQFPTCAGAVPSLVQWWRTKVSTVDLTSMQAAPVVDPLICIWPTSAHRYHLASAAPAADIVTDAASITSTGPLPGMER